MIPQQWTPPCNSQCTHKYAALMQIPWRVFCKKGCDADGDTWDECLGECDEICYKDPVLKDWKWSAYIDRSPGSVSYSQIDDFVIVKNNIYFCSLCARQQCFRACVSGCGYKFDIPSEQVDQVHSRPQPEVEKKPAPPAAESQPPDSSKRAPEDMPSTSA